jgi:hypothetical protein
MATIALITNIVAATTIVGVLSLLMRKAARWGTAVNA